MSINANENRQEQVHPAYCLQVKVAASLRSLIECLHHRNLMGTNNLPSGEDERRK